MYWMLMMMLLILLMLMMQDCVIFVWDGLDVEGDDNVVVDEIVIWIDGNCERNVNSVEMIRMCSEMRMDVNDWRHSRVGIGVDDSGQWGEWRRRRRMMMRRRSPCDSFSGSRWRFQESHQRSMHIGQQRDALTRPDPSESSIMLNQQKSIPLGWSLISHGLHFQVLDATLQSIPSWLESSNRARNGQVEIQLINVTRSSSHHQHRPHQSSMQNACNGPSRSHHFMHSTRHSNQAINKYNHIIYYNFQNSSKFSSFLIICVATTHVESGYKPLSFLFLLLWRRKLEMEEEYL